MQPAVTAVSRPVVARKPVSRTNPTRLPTRDILTLSRFDFINSTRSRTTVACRLAILAVAKGEKGSSTFKAFESIDSGHNLPLGACFACSGAPPLLAQQPVDQVPQADTVVCGCLLTHVQCPIRPAEAHHLSLVAHLDRPGFALGIGQLDVARAWPADAVARSVLDGHFQQASKLVSCFAYLTAALDFLRCLRASLSGTSFARRQKKFLWVPAVMSCPGQCKLSLNLQIM